MADDNMLGELQFELQERIREAAPAESYLELRGKLARIAGEEDGVSGVLARLVDALAESVDRLAAEVDKINDRV
jgi:predicted  nucleic acid-binding Zn-ribbon protein